MASDLTEPAPPRWARYFFPVGSTARPAVLRIVCVALQLLWFTYPLSGQLKLLGATGFSEPQVIVRGLLLVFEPETLRSAAVIQTVWWATTACGVLALVGLFTRVSLGAYAVGTMLLISHKYSYGEYHHPEAIYVLFLFVLAFGPCGDCLSVDAWRKRRGGGAGTEAGRPWYRGRTSRLAMWPLITAQCLVAVAYLDAATSKMLLGGLSWFNGYTLQNYLLFDGIRKGTLGVHVAPYRWVCVGLAIGAVAFESSFWLTLVPRLRRWVPLFIVGGVGLHLGIYLLQQAPFFTFMVLYLTWVPVERWGVIGGYARREPSPVEPSASAASAAAEAAEAEAPPRVLVHR